jgi:hypothetical protein
MSAVFLMGLGCLVCGWVYQDTTVNQTARNIGLGIGLFGFLVAMFVIAYHFHHYAPPRPFH